MKVKVIANYLPQYHRIPENDKWWGAGYTDWVAAKNAKPLFEGHKQPRIPLNNNYYDLSEVNTIRWQAQLAKRYGVYGFGIYHYWFNSNLQLLQKLAELLLQNKDIDINFMFIWDNDSWKRTWSNVKGNDWVMQDGKPQQGESAYLAELKYGDENDWEKHFNYLLPFFKDERYSKLDNKPMIGFMQPRNDIETQRKMALYWNMLAQMNGFAGILCMSRYDWRVDGLEYTFGYSWQHRTLWQAVVNKVRYLTKNGVFVLNYDKCLRKILFNAQHMSSKDFLSCIVRYDDTPRRGIKGTVVRGSTPQKFQKYFTELLKISKQQGKEYVFCPAWNEWGEGMYLEPDTVDGYAYLEALKAAVDEVNNYKIAGGGQELPIICKVITGRNIPERRCVA